MIQNIPYPRNSGLGILTNQASNYALRSSNLIKLSIAHLEFYAPIELQLKTGQLVTLLAAHNNGLKKLELLNLYYTDYEKSSAARQFYLSAALDKIIQRARKKYLIFGLSIIFSKSTNRFYLNPTCEFASNKAQKLQIMPSRSCIK